MGPEGSDIYAEGLLIPPCTLVEAGEMAIAEVPNGVYLSSLIVDGYESDIELKATLTISDCDMLLDFEGTDPCSQKGINVPLNYATAYSVFALRCIVGSDIPNNAGSLAPFRVVAPEGCILNAQAPAPVAMRHTIGQLTPDLVYGCLHQALPERVPAEGASCMYDLPLRSTPEAAQGDGHQFAIELVFNGGTGARARKDGLSVTAFPSGVWGSQVETTESVAAVLIKKRELRIDSGGAGRYRGGLGQRIELQPSGGDDILLFLSLERIRFAARGRDGGKAGAVGRVSIGTDGEPLPSKGLIRIPANETLIFETPGGGGMGDPQARDAELLATDIRDGLVSEQSAKLDYR